MSGGALDPVTENESVYAACWGKLDLTAPVPTFHPLICHLLDVAAVVETMWDEVVPPAMRARIASGLGLDESAARQWAAFLGALHDIGKLSPAFQLKAPGAEPRLSSAGLRSPQTHDGAAAPHGTVTARVLPALLSGQLSVAPAVAQRAATVVGGHHGVFPRAEDRQRLAVPGPQVGGDSWARARMQFVRALVKILEVPVNEPPGDLSVAAGMTLAGLVSVADWVGSNTDYFGHLADWDAAPDELDVVEYAESARVRARSALASLGWTGWVGHSGAANFAALFPHIAGMNPMQTAVVDLATEMIGPALVIVEAPMGEGKTEAAFYLADRWASQGQRGTYVALPTQATSNQMFQRLKSFLEARYPTERLNLQLLHGHASLLAEFQVLVRGARPFEPTALYAEADPPRESADIVAAEWFTHRKRGLLAPFGVGTVDQALLSVLQTRHAFVRLFGLANKTVVIDEVHAYDTYMSTLVDRLLEWLAALGSSVVLLSATLPRARTRELAAAYARGRGQQLAPAEPAGYPRVTGVTTQGVHSLSVGVSSRSRKTVHIVAVDWDPAVFGARVQEALADGGCAAVVCNTVRRAQDVYLSLKTCFPTTSSDGEPELDLLHARFPFAERERRELRARARFGPVGPRPLRAVLVATQVIEQSLDLDFDLLVTDLAPVDLVLQRAGRLHRHSRSRPPSLQAPELWMAGLDGGSEGVPALDPGTLAVYDQHVLLRSWLALRGRKQLGQPIRVPDDIQNFVESVYDDSQDAPADLSEAARRLWDASRAAMLLKRQHDRLEADKRAVRKPQDPGDIFEDFNSQLDEDEPGVHASLQALTRLTTPSVEIAVLRLNEAWMTTIQGKPPLKVARQILCRSLSLAHQGIVQHLMHHPALIPPGWRLSPLLRRVWPVLLDSGSTAQIGGYSLTLDSELGVVITSEEA